MEYDFFTNLPTEIMINIFLRLPVQSIVSCKCVCKSWRDLIKTPEFVDSHLSRSVPCLALFEGQRSKLFEFVDTQNSGLHDVNVFLDFSYPHNVPVHSSANGLLFLFDKYKGKPRNFFICNPITREYLKLPPPMGGSYEDNSFGFGVSKMTGRYKVVCISHSSYVSPYVDSWGTDSCKCEVYTLGTGSWRSVADDGTLNYGEMKSGVFFNGNLHWLARADILQRISYFDLETECFSKFSIPEGCIRADNISLLRDCLCLCDDLFRSDIVVIWLMNKYGDDKSWRKEVIIEMQRPCYAGPIPIKMYEDGDIFFAHPSIPVLYLYLSKTKTIRRIDLRKSSSMYGLAPKIYIPSFVPLKTIEMENVSSF